MDSRSRICIGCGEVFARNRKFTHAQWAVTRYCSRQCASQRLRKPLPLCACGCGQAIDRGRKWVRGHRPYRLYDGYRKVWRPDLGGMILEHRAVLHDAGVEIPDGWHVHHKNEVKTDNRLENLEVIEIAEHTRLHHRLNPPPPHCPKGHEYTPENTAFSNGWRYCKACNRANVRRYNARKKVPA